jgi:hypothetical protein
LCSLSITPVYCRAGVVVNYNTIFWLVKGLVLAVEEIFEMYSERVECAGTPRQYWGLARVKAPVVPAQAGT